MDKRVIFAVAGSGKTTYIVNTLDNSKRALIITYTENNFLNLRSKISKKFNGLIPENVTLMTYFKFLYNFCYKPILSDKIGAKGIDFNKKAPQYAKNTSYRYYLSNENYFYSNRLSLFLENFIEEIKKRLLKYFDIIIIDEIQDVAGRDFNFLVKLMRIETNFLFVGDFHQHTYDTSLDGNTNSNLFNDKESYEKKFAVLNFVVDNSTLEKSWRCSKNVCDYIRNTLKINIFSHNEGKGNLYILDSNDKNVIIKLWNDKKIIKLHYQKGNIYGTDHINWGDSKGIDKYFDVCVMLNKKTYQLLINDKLSELPPRTKNKFYVALTRAHNNVYLINEELVKSLIQE